MRSSFTSASLLFSCVVLLVAGTACNSASEKSNETQSIGADAPAFEWFEYTGQDPVYEDITAQNDEYLNPILAGFRPDPSIARAGENDYYVVTSSFAYFPGLPIFHSTDLVHWEQIGHAIHRPSQLDYSGLDVSEGIFAPTIRHHDGTFYVITTHTGGGGNFLITAENPSGPWSDPIWLPFDGIDPSLYFADDGRIFITNNGPPPGEPEYDGHRALWIQEYDPEAQEMVGPREVLVDKGVDPSEEPIWIEAPHIFKKNGMYYLIAAEGGTGPQHSEVVLRSDSVRGPYEPYEDNPILTQRHLSPDRPRPVNTAGHADFTRTPGGEWWAVFLATRPYENGFFNTGRETFLLPVGWTDDGWPVILERDETVPYVHDKPDLPQSEPPTIPTTGNFTVRTDFEGDSLASYWNFLRAPQDTWHKLENNSLRIEPQSASIRGSGQPSFVGRRQQHAHATATTALRFTPEDDGEKAGLTAFQNTDHYYFLAVTETDGSPTIQLEKAAGGETEIIASEELEHASDAPLYLRIEARGDEYDFSYSHDADAWIDLETGADGTILSTEVAGGFVGTYFGLYAHRE